MNWKKWTLLVIGGLAMVFLFVKYLGGEPKVKPDMTIFMMHEYNLPQENVDALEKEINEKLNGELVVDIMTSPLYNLQKIMVEYVAGSHNIVVIPYKDTISYSANGGNTALDEYFDKEKYPEGVLDGLYVEKVANPEKGEEKFIDHNGKFLFALPTEKLPMMVKHGLVEENWYAAIPGTNPDIERSVRLLKLLAETP